MEIYLPIAGMSINFFLVLGIGGLVGFLSGLFGVGGGFLLTPLMMMIGIPPAVAAASDSNQIVAAASSGAFAHWRLGNVDFKMGLIILAGGITGGTIGVQFVKVLRAMGNFEFVMKVVYVLMLGLVGGAMFIESWRTIRRSKSGGAGGAEEIGGAKLGQIFAKLPLKMHFHRSGLHTSAIFPFAIGTIVGIMAALLGVGGGFIMVPAMIYIIGMPTIAAIGTDLFQIVLTSANVTLQQAYGEPHRGPAAGPDSPGRLHHRGPVRGHCRQAPQRRADPHSAGHHRPGPDGEDLLGPGPHPQRPGEPGPGQGRRALR